MIADVAQSSFSRQRLSTPGSFPDDTVVSSNSACCHRARTGDKSGRHCSSEKLPGADDYTQGHPMTSSFSHTPVMLEEILEVFAPITSGVFLDATLGGAGHSCALLLAHPNMSLLGIDQDTDALRASQENLTAHGVSDRAALRHARFDEVKKVVAEEGLGSLAGALFDLGVSSHQFDVSERGFSYRFDAPLDMRMNQASTFRADDVVNGYEREQLVRLLRDNADERFATRIADAIIAARPISSTVRLAEIVVSAIPAPARRRGGHPAKRTFQAIRIEVNAELQILATALGDVIDLLHPGARLAVLSYHSGEDRIVKEVMRRAETGDCRCPAGLPCGCGAVKLVRRVRVAREASRDEQQENPRSTSARLRVVEKIGSSI